MLFKMSYHPLWQAWACGTGVREGVEKESHVIKDLGKEGVCKPVAVLHAAPNLMAISLRDRCVCVCVCVCVCACAHLIRVCPCRDTQPVRRAA